MRSEKVLLAVLGRGCMMAYPSGPWTVTGDFDWWKLGEKRPEVITSGPDDDPNVVIGGGDLQLAAAAMLYRDLEPVDTVFAFGNRSPYLKERNYPSESYIMSRSFTALMLPLTRRVPRVTIFQEDAWGVEGSSSYQEVHNILTFGKQLGVDRVVFLTVLVHMNRVLVMVAKHLREDPELAVMRNKIGFEVTESVLLREESERYAERVLAIFGSQAYLRNLERELNGSRAMYRGVTQTKQADPVVTTK